MQLPPNTKIAGWKTVADWNNLRVKLADFTDIDAWTSAYQDYFLTRLQHRYLNPIESIKDDGNYTGEGFSIMALICSLVEFLESTYQGKNYRHRERGDPPLGAFEYDKSSDIFVSFLSLRAPFKKDFKASSAKDFYRFVRCALLHEARTKGKWTIWGTTSTHILFETTTTEIVVYRDNFLKATNDFIENYKNELLNSNDRKEAFIRKYDNLCEE